MKPTPDVDLDDKPKPRPVSTHAGDVALAKDLILWARKNGVLLPEIHIGELHITVRDLKPRAGAGPDATPSSIYEEFGMGDPDAPT